MRNTMFTKNSKKLLLSPGYILLYAIVAGGLLSSTQFSLAFLPDRNGPTNHAVHLVDAVIVLMLNIAMFYASLFVNLHFVEKRIKTKLSINLLVYLVMTFLAIVFHRPVWEQLQRLPVTFFIRDELIRNVIIFSISAVVAKAIYNYQVTIEMKNKILEIQRQSLAGQIESLKQQINPHFFFNSLNTLSGLAAEDTQKTIDFIDQLSTVFRYVLEVQEKNLISIAEEMEFARSYIYLLKVRFEDKFSIEEDIKPNAHALVPSLCTQLLLENCFKHNSMGNDNPLKISVSTNSEFLIVRNSISRISSSTGTGIGLRNLNERCRLLMGKSIIISSENDFFIVKVPLVVHDECNID